MRTHLFTGGRTMFKKGWHDDSSKNMSFGHTWKEFTPYTNVLWIKYILGYLKKNFKEGGNAEELRKFEMDTSDLKTKLNPLTKVENGALSTAQDVYEYVCQKEWITLEQLLARNEGSSFLSDE
jgi:serine/threonine-protein kinase haspin